MNEKMTESEAVYGFVAWLTCRPPREYPCLCCSRLDRASKNAYCDACNDHDRWTAQPAHGIPDGEMPCGTCKHAKIELGEEYAKK